MQNLSNLEIILIVLSTYLYLLQITSIYKVLDLLKPELNKSPKIITSILSPVLLPIFFVVSHF